MSLQSTNGWFSLRCHQKQTKQNQKEEEEEEEAEEEEEEEAWVRWHYPKPLVYFAICRRHKVPDAFQLFY